MKTGEEKEKNKKAHLFRYARSGRVLHLTLTGYQHAP